MVSRSDHSSSRGQVLGLNTDSLVFLKAFSIMMIGVKNCPKETFHTILSLSCAFPGTKISDWENYNLSRSKNGVFRNNLCF